MINGPFGVGKTETANALKERIPNSVVFDAEEVGYMLRNITYPTGLEPPGDFQDITLWPHMVVYVTRALKSQYQKHLIMPIALPCKQYFQEIVQGIQQFEPEFYHFCLLASEATLTKRLMERDGKTNAWPRKQISRCLRAFEAPEYEVKLHNDNTSLEKIVQIIYARIM